MSSPEKDFPASEMNSDPTGFNTAPSHYAQQERETIDRIHDIMTDQEFKMFCLGQVVKYTDRLPHKGASGEDLAKANWYGQMALHMEDRGPDPRWQRPGFKPYQRQPAPPMQEMPFSMDQEPTVMPGFTAPVTDPWPPLSREQVVELHEALVAFLQRTAAGVDLEPAAAWSAAYDLRNELLHLGIGTPLPTKRWSEDQLQQAVEEAQQPRGYSQDLVDVALNKMQGMGSQWTWSGLPAKPTATLVTSPPEPVRKNCWTCRYNHPPVNNCDLNTRLYVALWVGTTKGWTTDGMPPKDADNCPGWEQKP